MNLVLCHTLNPLECERIHELLCESKYFSFIASWVVSFGTTIKKDIGEGHACDRPFRSVTNVTYGDGPLKSIVVSAYSDSPLRFFNKDIFSDTFDEGC